MGGAVGGGGCPGQLDLGALADPTPRMFMRRRGRWLPHTPEVRREARFGVREDVFTACPTDAGGEPNALLLLPLLLLLSPVWEL